MFAAMTIEHLLTRVWSGTTPFFNLVFPLTLCAMVAYFFALAEHYKDGMKEPAWRCWRWLPIFWVLGLLTVVSGGGTLGGESVAMCPSGTSHWVPC